jgi:hypothetical protein
MHVYVALFRIAKLWNQPRCPSTDEWVKRKVVYIHNGVLPIMKNEIMSFAKKKTIVGASLLVSVVSKICQTQKDKYCMFSLISEI